jgi:carboxypeptidase C (cathepsin A)
MWGGDSVPLFENTFKQAGLKVMLYSGNVDAVVPQLETDEYIKQINWKVTTPKYVVQNSYGSLEGWVTKYENNLVYYIINAAGHMVPCEKPAAALNMFENFIKGKL